MKESKGFREVEYSKCCDQPVGEVYTYPRVVAHYKKCYGVELPVYKDVKLCNTCKQNCEVVIKLKPE